MRYRLAYLDRLVRLCARQAETYPYPLGPVVDARKRLGCVVCEAEEDRKRDARDAARGEVRRS